MLDVLADRTYRYLFASQIVALLGTGVWLRRKKSQAVAAK